MSEINYTKNLKIETIGKRIAYLRSSHGWTQQNLANRLALSRVAVSHIEMDLILPSERTVTLLAGLFKIFPHELVRETTYPQAKAERLPETTCCYSRLELSLALFENDLNWLALLRKNEGIGRIKEETCKKWFLQLEELANDSLEDREKDLIAAARKKLAIELST